jgi:hypothetical protein
VQSCHQTLPQHSSGVHTWRQKTPVVTRRLFVSCSLLLLLVLPRRYWRRSYQTEW